MMPPPNNPAAPVLSLRASMFTTYLNYVLGTEEHSKIQSFDVASFIRRWRWWITVSFHPMRSTGPTISVCFRCFCCCYRRRRVNRDCGPSCRGEHVLSLFPQNSRESFEIIIHAAQSLCAKSGELTDSLTFFVAFCCLRPFCRL